MNIRKMLLISKNHCMLLFLLSLCLFWGGPPLSYGDKVVGVTDTTIKIGLMGDLTGPTADAWIPLSQGAKAFFKMVNDQGGIHGRKIKFILEDDRYSIPIALSCFKKLVFRDRIFVLQAASGVGHTAALIPLVEREKIPLIAANTERRFYYPARKYIFCGMPWYSDQAKLVLKYIFNDLKLKDPTLALLYPDVASGKDTRDTLRESVKAYPVKKYEETVISLGGVDFTSEILTLKKLRPDFIYMHGFVANTAAVVKAAKRFKIDTPILVNQYGCADEVLKMTGKAAEGLMAINCFGVWDDTSPGVNKLRRAALRHNPDIPRRSAFFFNGWLAAMLFYNGFDNAGRNLTRESYLEGLESIRNLDTQGICGFVSFSPNDHKAIDNHRFYKADTGIKRFVPISGWRSPTE